MRYKLWRRRLSVSAPRMTIKRHLPWPVRLIVAVLIIGLGGALAMWTYDLGHQLARSEPEQRGSAAVIPVETMQTTVSTPAPEPGNATDSQLMILRSAQEQLIEQVAALERENTRLKEDLAFFESLVPTRAGSQGIAIQRLMAELIAPNQLRYRLLVMSSSRKERGFKGSLQVAVNVIQAGKSTVIIFPHGNSSEVDKFQLEFEHYQRIEGTVVLPEGAVAKGIQARVLEKGKIRAQQSANL